MTEATKSNREEDETKRRRSCRRAVPAAGMAAKQKA